MCVVVHRSVCGEVKLKYVWAWEHGRGRGDRIHKKEDRNSDHQLTFGKPFCIPLSPGWRIL